MRAAMSHINVRLEERIDAVDIDSVARKIANEGVESELRARQQLRKYLAESRVALRLAEPHLAPGARILEVGSGMGFFAGFLHEEGYDVVELEPVGQGFDFMGMARRALASESRPRLLDHGVEDLDPQHNGPFDVILSLNVLEHVTDWRLALDAAVATLAPKGKLVVSCPNYAIPYEPHFGIPLVPIKPQLTSRILPSRITQSGLWQSLNWITLRGVRRWADQRDVTVSFEQGLLARVFDRLNDDEEFGKRHGPVLRSVARGARLTRLDRAIAALPPGAVTPMEFVVTPGETGASDLGVG